MSDDIIIAETAYFRLYQDGITEEIWLRLNGLFFELYVGNINDEDASITISLSDLSESDLIALAKGLCKIADDLSSIE
jgi:hypothetical protein